MLHFTKEPSSMLLALYHEIRIVRIFQSFCSRWFQSLFRGENVLIRLFDLVILFFYIFS